MTRDESKLAAKQIGWAFGVIVSVDLVFYLSPLPIRAFLSVAMGVFGLLMVAFPDQFFRFLQRHQKEQQKPRKHQWSARILMTILSLWFIYYGLAVTHIVSF